MNIVLKNLTELMKEKKINARQLQLHFGLSNSAFTKWKTRDAIPGLELLCRFAEYFEVDVSYFYSAHGESASSVAHAEVSKTEIVRLMEELGLTRDRIESLDEEKKKLLIAVVDAFFDKTQKQQ